MGTAFVRRKQCHGCLAIRSAILPKRPSVVAHVSVVYSSVRLPK